MACPHLLRLLEKFRVPFIEGFAFNPITKSLINGIVTKLENDNLDKPEELLKITFGEDYKRRDEAAVSAFLFAILDKYKETLRR